MDIRPAGIDRLAESSRGGQFSTCSGTMKMTTFIFKHANKNRLGHSLHLGHTCGRTWAALGCLGPPMMAVSFFYCTDGSCKSNNKIPLCACVSVRQATLGEEFPIVSGLRQLKATFISVMWPRSPGSLGTGRGDRGRALGGDLRARSRSYIWARWTRAYTSVYFSIGTQVAPIN